MFFDLSRDRHFHTCLGIRVSRVKTIFRAAGKKFSSAVVEARNRDIQHTILRNIELVFTQWLLKKKQSFFLSADVYCGSNNLTSGTQAFHREDSLKLRFCSIDRLIQHTKV